ncbi:MAG: leucyl aminopeptidase [Kiritimatiellia bacterium]|nr:leucyl aminopeptidase [Kiritimatiellia bacterium]
MQFSFHTTRPGDSTPVIWAHSSDQAAAWIAAPAGLLPILNDFATRARFRGEAGTVRIWPLPPGSPAPAVLVAGLGPRSGSRGDVVERTTASAVRLARKEGFLDLCFEIAGPGSTAVETARQIGRGAQTGNYVFSRFLTDAAAAGKPVARIRLSGRTAADQKVRAALREGALEGQTLNDVRDLSNLPGNEATPKAIAAAAQKIARKTGLKCTVLNPEQLEKAGFRALLAVARGSRHEPRLIVLEHRGQAAYSKEKPLVFVGKTLTFDSGGISLKPGKGMEWMRYDKCGGMAVLAAMASAGALKLPRPAVGILVAAENMPDGNATRPGDVVRSLGGPSIEIINTDAEGRLVLADALAWAGKFKPAALVDLATLTGAVLICLGHEASALLSPHNALAQRLQALGETTGDRLWPLPLWPEYDEALKTPFADVKNIGDGTAGTIAGAAFLKKFVPKNVPWAHLDIAGTAWLESEKPWQGPGATLFGARLLIEWMRQTPKGDF